MKNVVTTGKGPERRDDGLEQPDPESDIAWWASRARDGDRQAIESLIRRSYARVLALCQARLLRRVDAEDAAQEVFVRAIRGLAEIRAPEAVGGWFRGIAVHVCADMLRRSYRTTEICSAADLFETEDSVERADERQFVVECVHELPEELREVVLLFYFDSMSYEQIAQWLGVARSTVNERLSRAREQLRRRLLAGRRES